MPTRRMRDVRKLLIMPKKCKTCPFNDDGCKELRKTVEARLLEVSQTCHSTGVARTPPRKDTHICRGARNYQNEMMYRLGVISAPTDEAWEAKRKELGI